MTVRTITVITPHMMMLTISGGVKQALKVYNRPYSRDYF